MLTNRSCYYVVAFLRVRGQSCVRAEPTVITSGKERHPKIRLALSPPPPEQDVLLALSEEVHRLEAEKKGATIDLPQYFQAKASVETERVYPLVFYQGVVRTKGAYPM